MSDEPLPSSFKENPQFSEETSRQKFFRRLKEEPLIPLGCAATCYALWRAYRSMKVGDSIEMNRMFRARIYAQAFTLVAVVAGGIYYKQERQHRKEFEKAVEARKAQQKRDAWLRELEIRDREDREWRERHAAIKAAAEEAGKTKRSGGMVASPSSSSTGGPASPSEQNNVRAVVESTDRKIGGISDAVSALISGKKA